MDNPRTPALLVAVLLVAAGLGAEPLTEDAQSRADAREVAVPEAPLSPRDKALLAHERRAALERRVIARCRARGTASPTPSWREWDPDVEPRRLARLRREARAIPTGSIARPRTRCLVQMELSVRRVARALERDGFLSDPERETLHRAFARAGQAMFPEQNGRGVRPGITARIEALAFPPAAAQELMAQFIRLAHVVRMLAGPPQTPAKRAALEAEYVHLAAQLYE